MELYELLLQLFQILVAAITAYLVKRVDHSQKSQKKRIKHNNKNVKKFVSSILTLFETGREAALEEELKSRSILHTTEHAFSRSTSNQKIDPQLMKKRQPVQNQILTSNPHARNQRVTRAISTLRELKENPSVSVRDDDSDSCSSVETKTLNPLNMSA